MDEEIWIKSKHRRIPKCLILTGLQLSGTIAIVTIPHLPLTEFIGKLVSCLSSKFQNQPCENVVVCVLIIPWLETAFLFFKNKTSGPDSALVCSLDVVSVRLGK